MARCMHYRAVHTHEGIHKMLLGSSNTLEGITQVITAFYCGSRIALFNNIGTNTFEVHNINGRITDVMVRKVRGRYRFETTGGE